MKYQFLIFATVSAALSACGGSGSNSLAGASSGSTYHFVAPSAGATNTYSETLVDNLNNTINTTLVEVVNTINTDGSISTAWHDPSNSTTTTGTVDHTFYPTTYILNNVAQEESRTITRPNNNIVNCTDTPHGAGAPSPLTAGQTWTFSFSETCGTNNPVTYTQSGTYVGTESLTVPAGTFNAYKFQSTITWTNGNGTAVTQSVTLWRNAASGDSRALKEASNFSYSGTTPPQGSLVSSTRTLQSYQ